MKRGVLKLAGLFAIAAHLAGCAAIDPGADMAAAIDSKPLAEAIWNWRWCARTGHGLLTDVRKIMESRYQQELGADVTGYCARVGYPEAR